jgi:DNA-binding protein YbaB
VNNDAAREQLADMLLDLQDQMGDIAKVQQTIAALQVERRAAEDSITVTVNARGQLVKAVVDESFLHDHDFEELGHYLTEAARAAADEAGRRVAELMAPINERHKKFPSFSDIVAGLPDPANLMSPGLDIFGGAAQPPQASTAGRADDDVAESGFEFPTVRK